MSTEVYSIKQLVQMGYPERKLKNYMHHERFSEIGFRTSDALNSKVYFYKDKLNKFIANEEEERAGR